MFGVVGGFGKSFGVVDFGEINEVVRVFEGLGDEMSYGEVFVYDVFVIFEIEV